MYLKPRIKYYGISSGYKNLKVKWYNPNGTLKTGTSSPYGFSQSEDCFIYSGSDNTYSLNGWGNRNKVIGLQVHIELKCGMRTLV